MDTQQALMTPNINRNTELAPKNSVIPSPANMSKKHTPTAKKGIVLLVEDNKVNPPRQPPYQQLPMPPH